MKKSPDNQISEKLTKFSGKLQTNKWINALSSSLMATMPILMVGALCSLIRGLPIGDAYTEFLSSSGLSAVLSVGVATCNLIALFFICALGFNLGKALEQKPFNTIIIALMSFLLVTPLSTTVTDPETGEFLAEALDVIPIKWLGAEGLFTAILIGYASIILYSFLVNKKITIRMPESVPPIVSQPFEAIIPAIIVAALFLTVQGLFGLTSFDNLHQFIFSVVQLPLASLGNGFGAFIIAMLFSCLLWVFGIHGSMVVLSIMLPIWMPAAIQNMTAFSTGAALPYDLTFALYLMIMQFLGGDGCLIGLTLTMPIFAKSQRYKALGKVAVVPGIFNIIEPIVFGFPIMFNPIMAIPFIATPILLMSVTYALIKIGFFGNSGVADDRTNDPRTDHWLPGWRGVKVWLMDARDGRDILLDLSAIL
ncbi:PTS sugar transporter subunit IIC [Paenibacillus lutimineralis]|uniref:PTS sugar transporter subunit IIC n=1 Tax=Paenibacillus lutimineralis TaxID=2707005 RepID=UPI001D04B649|nr:PTS transporter subunit EIIC [Paenibacillus lutimineralis]